MLAVVARAGVRLLTGMVELPVIAVERLVVRVDCGVEVCNM